MSYPIVVPLGHKIVPLEPTEVQVRALIKWRGYDPDASSATLDRVGMLDIATLSVFIQAYKILVNSAEEI